MVRKLVSATVSAALCLMPVAPAMAQDYRFAGFDAPRGATATVNVRVPMGREHADRASYGLTLGYGRTVAAPGFEGRTASRAVNFADFRFNGTELRQARIASLDLANPDRSGRRMNLTAGGGQTMWLVIGVAAGAALVCFVITDCFGDDDEDNDNN
jgi:hypothetical protein